jgi:hypothetical protein
MERKRRFEPGDMVTTFTGQAGIVISEGTFSEVRNRLKEGRRPGHYFAPGCCPNPDYVTQIPVLFEDRMYDVMRGTNIKKAPDLPAERQRPIQEIIDDLGIERRG